MKTQQMQKGSTNVRSKTDYYTVPANSSMDIQFIPHHDGVKSKQEHSDQYQETLCKRIWLSLIRDLYPEPLFKQMDVYFSKHRLADLIGAGVDVAEYVLRPTSRPVSPFMVLYEYTDMTSANRLRCLLTVCRFGKRYTPFQLSVDTTPFWETNDRLGNWDWNRETILGWLRTVLEEWLEGYYVNHDEWSLTSGATFDSDNTIVDKLLSAEKVFPSLLGISLGTPQWNVRDGQKEPYYYNRIKAVPKNYKSPRFIAIEPQWMNVQAQPVAKAIERCLPAYANIHDQSHNLNLALLGSRDNSLCTIDLSGASDSNARELCRAILPERVFSDIYNVTSHSERPKLDKWGLPKTRYDRTFGRVETTRKYHMISTMGNRVTFPLETLIFSAFVQVAADVCGIKIGTYNAGVYGDDMVCPTEIVETLIDLLTSCGFIVNKEKSFFGTEFFRESCGGEYFHGESVSSIYWPRQALDVDNCLPSLVALQHKVYKLPYTNACIVEEVQRLCPKMTQSFPGSLYDDIWAIYPDVKRAYGSYRGRSPELEPSCEIHTSFEAEGGRTDWCETLDRFKYYTFLKYGHRDHEDPLLAAIGYPAEETSTWGSVHPAVRAKNRKYLV